MVHLRCNSKCQVFEPWSEYRAQCPYVLLVCSGEHSHPIPLPTRTPPHVRRLIFNLLDAIEQDLPDLTARRFLRHPVIKAHLREAFPQILHPALSDIHISLANREHLRSYIEQAKNKYFPAGTGWDGEHYPRTLVPKQDVTDFNFQA